MGENGRLESGLIVDPAGQPAATPAPPSHDPTPSNGYSALRERVKEVETDLKWLKRIGWALLAAVVISVLPHAQEFLDFVEAVIANGQESSSDSRD